MSRSRPIQSAAGLLAVAVLPSAVMSQQSATPINAHPTRMSAFETGNMLPAGSLELNIGNRQANPSGGTGTGNQTYYGGGSYAPSDRFALGVDVQNYMDPIGGPVAGYPDPVEIETTQLALWGKYQLYKDDRWAIASLVSVESYLSIKSHFWGGYNGTSEATNVIIGSLKAPITYKLSPKLQLHFTPGVSIAPDTLGGAQFYGTIATLGGGFSFKPSERSSVFGAIDMPVSGKNTINSDGTWDARPIWTIGTRYAVTPRVALEGYLTNGWGMTSATSIQTFWPDGDHVLAGLRAVYLPGAKRPESFRTLTLPPPQDALNLQQDGFTLGSADTLEPGNARLELWGGSLSNMGTGLFFSPDRDLELQFIFEEYADSVSSDPNLVPTTHVRYMIGPKLRFLDQNQGNAISLSGRVLFGRQIHSSRQKVGVFYTDLAARYRAANQLSFTANPKFAAFGDTQILGFGIGLNYQMSNGLQLLAEVTPVTSDASDPTWAVGARYNLGRSGFSIDAQATNAIGRYGIGSMVAQDDTRFALTLSKRFDLTRYKFY